MTGPVLTTAEQLFSWVQSASRFYHRLVLLVGPRRTGKTIALREFARPAGAPVINVNLALSQALLDVPRAQRSLRGFPLLREITAAAPGGIVILDNLEILFAPDLKLDPLRALQQVSRDRTVVAAWNGRCHGGRLTYAEPSHPEYRDYPAQGLLIVAASHHVVRSAP